jgi:hypothetical protein
MSDKPTLLFDVLDALEDALKHCAPDKRRVQAILRGRKVLASSRFSSL